MVLVLPCRQMKRCFSEVEVDMDFGPNVDLIWNEGSMVVYVSL